MTKLVLPIPSKEELEKLASGDIGWFVSEIDSHTPSIPKNGVIENRKINRRLIDLFKIILDTSRDYFSKTQQIKLIQALRYAAKKHIGVYRKDGRTPYIHHPLEVVVIIIDLGVYDFKLIVAAILHDIPEDTSETPNDLIVALREIGRCFGARVGNIVSLVTVPPDSVENAQFFSFIKISANAFFSGLGDDFAKKTKKPFDIVKKQKYWLFMKKEPDLNTRWRVLLLKLADRLHNMLTIAVMSEEKRAYKIEETRREFLELYEILEKTLTHLYAKGTIKKKYLLDVPRILWDRINKEMSKYS